jgi:type I restriction enzyme S subunit
MVNQSQFFEMTKASNSIKIENVAKDVFAGGDKPKDHSAVQSEQYKYPVFSNGIGDNALLCFSKECRVKEAAITVSARGTIGYAECREAGFTPVVRLLTLIPKEGYQLAYLKFALNSITFHSTGSSQGQLTAPDFCKYEIPNAPFDVQVVFGSIVQQADKSKYLN